MITQIFKFFCWTRTISLRFLSKEHYIEMFLLFIFVFFSRCINIHGTHVTTDNSTNNNMFFFVSDLKIVYYKNYQSLITMPRTRDGKNNLHHYLFGYKIIQNLCKQNLTGSLSLTIIPQKNQIYCWVHKFQATGSVNNINKKAGNLRSGWKFTARCSDNVDMVRDSVRSSLKKSLQRHSQELPLSHAL